jgi:hypothetical protein
MTVTPNTKTTVNARKPAATQDLTGLFDEMQALMALLPGASYTPHKPLPTEEETEAMFDNMPV